MWCCSLSWRLGEDRVELNDSEVAPKKGRRHLSLFGFEMLHRNAASNFNFEPQTWIGVGVENKEEEESVLSGRVDKCF